MMDLLAPKQLNFILQSTKKINLAHGSVRSGKTVCTLFRFMQAVDACPDSQIWMIGHTSSTIYDNAVRLILEPKNPGIPDPLSIFRPFCTWRKGERELLFKDKVISTVGAKDSGAIGAIQGKTMSLAYCDEMTLYPESIIDMISTRLSNPHSMLFASMNPSHPSHKLKQWIDKADSGDKNYYQLHFTLEDNPYLEQDYKDRIKNSLSGVFYKRNYLGEWCLAEGAIFDFFDRSIYVVSRPPRAADYWIVGIDYGTNNAFAAVLIGVNAGMYQQTGKMMWVEKEYYWDSKVKGRQKTNSEFADDLKAWMDPFDISECCQDLINQRPFGDHPFYIFAHARTIGSDEKFKLFLSGQYKSLDQVPEKTLIWQPRLTKPVSQDNSMLFKAYPGTDIIKVIWMLPARELWDQYTKGKMTENKTICDSINLFLSDKRKLEEKEEDDMTDEQIDQVYKEISRNIKKSKIVAT